MMQRGKENCKENHDYNLKFNLMVKFEKNFKIKYKFWNINQHKNFSERR